MTTRGGDDNMVWVFEVISRWNPNSDFCLHMSYQGAQQDMRDRGFRPLPIICHEEDYCWIRPKDAAPWDEEESWCPSWKGQHEFELGTIYQMEVGW